MEEIWKDIPEFEKLYQASNWGRIRSLDRYVNNNHNTLSLKKGRILKPALFSGKYLGVTLVKDNKKYSKLVHILVWSAFNGSVPDGYEVNHIDEDTTNPKLENLNLLTRRENINWGTANKRRVVTRRKNGNYKMYPIVQRSLDGELIKYWNCSAEVERELGYNQSNIRSCCKGEQITSYGYKWNYA